MKIALLAPLPPPVGGIGTWALRVADALPDGYSIEFVNEALLGGREFFGEMSKKNFAVEVKRCFGIWKSLLQVLNDSSVEIVHSNIPTVYGGMLRELVCCALTKWRKRKFVIHYHCTTSVTVDNAVKKFLFKALSNASDAVITLNNASFEFTKSCVKSEVYLLPNFISQHEMRDSKAISENILRALYVGGVCADKGIYEYLSVAKEFPNIEFVAIGKIEKGVQDCASENVVLTGPLPHNEIEKWMEESDVFFFLSRYEYEGFSVALTEAMGAGLPCIVSDWAANKDMIAPDGGVVVPCRDAAKAAKALRSLEDPAVRGSCSRANIRRVKQEYSTSKVMHDLVEIYSRI